MDQPSLPLELHQLIIDIIGDDAIHAQPAQRAKEDPRDSLGACSLVCKDWHAHTLRYTFYRVHFILVDSDKDLTRRAELFRLLEVNPLITRYIRRAKIYLSLSVSPGGVETLCSAISPVETFILRLESSGFNLPSPSTLDGLRPILTAPHLRHFSIHSSHLPTSLLEALANVRSLSLEGVRVVVVDHDSDAGPWRSSMLEKLDVTNARCFLKKIGPLMDSYCGLSAFFDHLKHLTLSFDTQDVFADSPWHIPLARWKRLETLIVGWRVFGKSVSAQ